MACGLVMSAAVTTGSGAGRAFGLTVSSPERACINICKPNSAANVWPPSLDPAGKSPLILLTWSSAVVPLLCAAVARDVARLMVAFRVDSASRCWVVASWTAVDATSFA